MPPTYPLTVIHEDGERWVLHTPTEVAGTVEWYDSADDDDSMRVVDAEGRPVRLKVEALQIITCEVDGSAAPAPSESKRRVAA